MKKFITISVLLLTGCASLAPTTYELNRRSGLGVSLDDGSTKEGEAQLASLQGGPYTASPASQQELPDRLPPVIEKVWVFDQIINEGQWLKGTWVYLEIEGARWRSELESSNEPIFELKD
jgi:hypothetical protein